MVSLSTVIIHCSNATSCSNVSPARSIEIILPKFSMFAANSFLCDQVSQVVQVVALIADEIILGILRVFHALGDSISSALRRLLICSLGIFPVGTAMTFDQVMTIFALLACVFVQVISAVQDSLDGRTLVYLSHLQSVAVKETLFLASRVGISSRSARFPKPTELILNVFTFSIHQIVVVVTEFANSVGSSEVIISAIFDFWVTFGGVGVEQKALLAFPAFVFKLVGIETVLDAVLYASLSGVVQIVSRVTLNTFVFCRRISHASFRFSNFDAAQSVCRRNHRVNTFDTLISIVSVAVGNVPVVNDSEVSKHARGTRVHIFGVVLV